jgi:DNA-binding beta-propeller fold protein YncE
MRAIAAEEHTQRSSASQPASGPKPLYGKVVSVDTMTGKVVVADGDDGKQVTVATDPNTKVVIADKPAKLADLKAGMSVRVFPPTGTAAQIRAFSPKPPASQPASGPKPLYGKVVSVDTMTGKLVITAAGDEGKQVTVATDPATKVVIADKAATLADLKAGMMVRVVPPTGTAAEIRAFLPKPPASQPASGPKPLYGKVVSVDTMTDKVVIATGEDGNQVTIATDFNTKVVIADKPAMLADLKAGTMVRVMPPTGTAAEIRAFLPKRPAKGETTRAK